MHARSHEELACYNSFISAVDWPFLRAGLSYSFWAQPAVLINTMRANTDLLTDCRLTKEDHEPWSVISPQTSTNPEHTCASVPPFATELRFKCRNKWCLLYWWLTAKKEQTEKPNFAAVAVCRPITIMPTNVSVPNKFPQRVFIRKINPHNAM